MKLYFNYFGDFTGFKEHYMRIFNINISYSDINTININIKFNSCIINFYKLQIIFKTLIISYMILYSSPSFSFLGKKL